MKLKIYILIISVQLSVQALGQANKQSKTKPALNKPISNKLSQDLLSTDLLLEHEIGAGSSNFWLTMSFPTLDKYKTYNSVEIADKLEEYCSKPYPNDSSILHMMIPFHVKYKDKIKRVLYTNSSMGKVLTNFYCDLNNKALPVSWSVSNDKDLNFLLTRIGYNKEFNTLRTSSRQRATQVFTSMIVPSLNNFSPIYEDLSIKYITIIIHYACRDFSRSESVMSNTEIETLAFSATTKDIKSFCDGKITEDEIIRRSIFNLRDKDMKSGVKRIELKIE